jgi:hypothetical protein
VSHQGWRHFSYTPTSNPLIRHYLLRWQDERLFSTCRPRSSYPPRFSFNLRILLANPQSPDTSVEVDRVQSEVPGRAGQFANSIPSFADSAHKWLYHNAYTAWRPKFLRCTGKASCRSYIGPADGPCAHTRSGPPRRSAVPWPSALTAAIPPARGAQTRPVRDPSAPTAPGPGGSDVPDRFGVHAPTDSTRHSHR